MEDDHHKTPSPSFRDRRMKSKLKISCFRQLDLHLHSPIQSPTLKKSPSSSKLFKSSKMRLKDLTTTTSSRHRSGGGTTVNRHQRHPTNDFKYDPLSYSLNFEEHGDHLHIHNFISRLPLTPPTGINEVEDLTTKRFSDDLICRNIGFIHSISCIHDRKQ
ncbi:uncharacterized protein [Rutidosis leptorrhynchoides]|uniref:uncharacterized protein n=1 Tax=Rutidosis leptorrhynchoides TaxID=125765 RepID=UPI003A99963C